MSGLFHVRLVREGWYYALVLGFIVGGAVQGRKTYGTFPTLSINGPDDVNSFTQKERIASQCCIYDSIHLSELNHRLILRVTKSESNAGSTVANFHGLEVVRNSGKVNHGKIHSPIVTQTCSQVSSGIVFTSTADIVVAIR